MKQIADELGVDKQRVYRFINKECIEEVAQSGQMKLYDETAQNRIKQHFLQSQPNQRSKSNETDETVIEALLKQLEIKDKQIADLIADKNRLQLSLDQAQALHAGTIQTQLLSEGSEQSEQATETDKKRGFFGWLFK